MCNCKDYTPNGTLYTQAPGPFGKSDRPLLTATVLRFWFTGALSDKKFLWTAERQSNRAILFSPRATRAGTSYSMGSDEPQVCQKKAGCALGMLHSSHSVILQWAILILGNFLNSEKRPAVVQNRLDFQL